MNPIQQDIEAEESVLGCLLLSESALGEVLPILRHNDFYRPMNAAIFQAIVQLDADGSKVDQITLTAALRQAGTLDEVGGHDYVWGLTSAVPATSNARSYASIVAEKARERRLSQAAIRIHDLPLRGLSVDEQERQSTEILEAAINDVPVMSTIATATRAVEELDAELVEAMRTGTRKMGLPTGLNAYDSMTYGLHGGQLIVVAARPGMGKSAFAFQVALSIAEQGCTVSVHSLEMSRRELMMRAVSCFSGIDLQLLMMGVPTPDMVNAYQRAIDRARALAPRLLLDDRGTLTTLDVRQTARGIRRRHGLDLVVVDYIQLMRGSSNNARNRNDEVSEITRDLKVMARDLDLPVLAISQLNRNLESRGDKRPMLSDLRDSGSVEQDADVVALLYRDDYYTGLNSERPGLVELNIAKQRNGPTGTRELPFRARTASFANMAGSTSPHPPAPTRYREDEMPL